MACKKRMDSKELSRIYRALQNAYALKETEFSSKEMDNLMKVNGIPRNLFTFMVDKGNTYFLVSKRKHASFYQFPKIPVHENVMYTLLQEYYSKKKKEYSFSVEEAIELLKQEGYRIFKDKGINVEALRKELPQIYEKFVEVEEV